MNISASETMAEIVRTNCFSQVGKTTISSVLLIRQRFKGLNRACPYLNQRSLKITTTVPLNQFKYQISTMFAKNLVQF